MPEENKETKNLGEDVKYAVEVVSKVLSSLDPGIRNIFKDSTLVKMIVFIVREINENKELKQAEVVDEEKLDIVTNAFQSKFHSELKGKNILLPVFVGYLIKAIDRALIEEEQHCTM